MNNYTPSENCILLTTTSEGCKLESYRDSGGICTIGYGHTYGVTAGMTITQEQANDFLMQDLTEASKYVTSFVTSLLNQNQFDSLTDFVYNLGAGSFHYSVLLKLINANPNDPNIKHEFFRWVYCDGKVLAVAGLVKRRQAEWQLYSTPC